MFLDLFQSVARGEPLDLPLLLLQLAALIALVLVSLPLHELAHAYTAYLFGDDTARLKGRISFNPIRHLDPIGTAMIFLFGFGFAKPVPINPNNFYGNNKNKYKAGIACTALAGPLANFILGFLSMLIMKLMLVLAPNSISSITSATVYMYVYWFFLFFAHSNIMLGVFNLLPIPPLDGSRVVMTFLPIKIINKVFQYENIIRIITFALLFSGFFSGIVSSAGEAIYSLFAKILSF